MTYKLKDNKGINYIVKDIKIFARHIFDFHATGTSVHQENGHDFIVNDEFREKILQFLELEKMKKKL